jgi:hypothetical protein
MDALGKHFHKICKAKGIKPKNALWLLDEIKAEMEPMHGPDCRDFGIEDGCPVCDTETN